MSSPKDFEDRLNRRTVATGIAGGLMFSGLVARLAQLQLFEGQRYMEIAKENGVKLDLAPPRRGTIYDRFGVPLASHRQAGRVSIIREQTPNLEASLSEIARHIDLPPEQQARIARQARQQASFQSTIVRSELSYEDFARMSLIAASIPGVEVDMAATRSYPRGRDFAHVLGYVAKASQDDLARLTKNLGDEETRLLTRLFKHPDMRTGRSGVERHAEAWLRGEPGFRRLETNAAGRVIRELESDDLAPTPGKDIGLTVDAELQRAAIERFGEESGAAVVLDIETGAILAFVSTPAFDPNDFVNGISYADYNELRENDRSPLYHKAYDGTYPPGSTFKMVVATAALEAGINPEMRVHCNRYYRFGNRTWHCWKAGGHGSVNMHWAIKGSCDVYFYEIARRVGVEKIAEVSKKFGFGQRWELGLTGGRAGTVPNDEWKRKALGEPWYEGETLNYGIGQGYLATTPLQLALMSARIAAKGRIIEPYIIGDGPRPDEPIKEDAPLDPEMMERMMAGMYGVTSEAGGTAWRSGDLGLGGPRLAGKTGTAQVRRITEEERRSGVLKGDQIDRKLRDHALFVAYAPADDPKYAISVVVEHGEGGSSTAAPVARDILAEAIRRDSRKAAKWQQTAGRPSGGNDRGAP
ncbi:MULTISPECIES: penicillin-binding protein 2 [Henriciella]|jgi:penicillin-binding protein 2|uniref:Peptidoglycan glycosyltransferase n=1 Tax=Henriciella pelagia TaxID=1977912 RepID=A0ABQ1JEQ2_9PROT|nr:penicillin-binding protein 2 [Henriciella pelagia]GGB66645.1 peptidoglycan glycosyltransferase [Henriciella pelagia]